MVKKWNGKPHEGAIAQCDEEHKWYEIKFEDGDVEDWTHEELLKHIGKEALAKEELIKHMPTRPTTSDSEC